MNKYLLKKLIFQNLLGLIKHSHPEAEKEDNFAFILSKDGNNIIFKSVVEEVYGNSCWEDSKSKTRDKSIHFVNENRMNDCIHELIIQEYQFKEYSITNDDDIIKYYDNLKREFYFDTEIEDINVDHYYNCERLRTMIIPLDDIAEYLLTFKYTKPLNDIKNFKYVKLEENKEIEKEFNVFKLNEKLTENLSKKVNEKTQLKAKI